MSIQFCMLLFPCYQCHTIQVSHDVNMQKTHYVSHHANSGVTAHQLTVGNFLFLNTSIGKDQQI